MLCGVVVGRRRLYPDRYCTGSVAGRAHRHQERFSAGLGTIRNPDAKCAENRPRLLLEGRRRPVRDCLRNDVGCEQARDLRQILLDLRLGHARRRRPERALRPLRRFHHALYQLIEANFGMFGARAHGGGVAFFAHVGGFVFGFVVARVLLGAGRIAPQDDTAFRAPA